MGSKTELDGLAEMLFRYAPEDGNFPLPFPGAYVYRNSRSESEVRPALYEPAVCLVAQGAKAVFYGQEVVRYDPAHVLISTLDLPLRAQVLEASPKRPFLCLKLVLDPSDVTELAAKVYPEGLPPGEDRPIFVGKTTPALLDVAWRFLKALEDPGERKLLAPLYLREFLIRLLRESPTLARLSLLDPQLRRIARAINHIRAHFREPLDVRALAQLAHMGESAFYKHFRRLTSLTPLQYQKALRLQEARRLLLDGLSVTQVAQDVGYASPSQFIREYRRFFGAPPSKDTARLREKSELFFPQAG
ncbi:RCS-specific HTH-type transcriptional activator RclR [Meiothermus luteus]|jgi:AraC-like DNA-binding protein|uniref:RCS-specific HTH-type transcriptional activator RclR n=1 Tax=Meiothermus luteus TaxID=2026184 RepID=A0A399ETD7_9DEIN|nr:AraC family transcriptional regulator [Meiothermus luteus]RIH85491.1 RCS-specific HTH-type transcriptional activator RclR [Meiothermus luteus]RMH58179.1 MAG: helix-turn-helix domain-containing protein [Deinococcota bacterium]